MRPSDVETALDRSRVLWDSEIWRVWLNIQHRFERASSDELYAPEDLDEICLDFHKPLAVPERIRKHRRVGSLWIKVDLCGVRLLRGDRVIVRSGDSTAALLSHFSQMLDFRLVEVEIDHPGGDTRFKFADDRTLECFPAVSTGGATWVVVTEEGDEFRFESEVGSGA